MVCGCVFVRVSCRPLASGGVSMRALLRWWFHRSFGGGGGVRAQSRHGHAHMAHGRLVRPKSRHSRRPPAHNLLSSSFVYSECVSPALRGVRGVPRLSGVRAPRAGSRPALARGMVKSISVSVDGTNGLSLSLQMHLIMNRPTLQVHARDVGKFPSLCRRHRRCTYTRRSR